MTLLSAQDAEVAALGIECVGESDLAVVVTDPARRLGGLRVQSIGRNNVIYFDNARWGGNCFGNIRIIGSNSLLFFNDIGDGYVAMHDLLMRSNSQIMFWGAGSTAVGLSMEIEGEGSAVVIGDDALISSGVWIRNYDMHAMHDLRTGGQINRKPCDTVLERHVWLGQDTLLLSCERVGMGSIIGARALAKGRIPPRVVAAGTPAKVIRENASWGRHPYGMTDAERHSINHDSL
jgi:carbonic anhydrase/acetyltransferase-like protein (isoleucine patch superfamily)